MPLRCMFYFLFILVIMISAGCSDKKPMRGKVTFADDGSPLTRGIVVFQSDTILARGTIKQDGTYVMGSEKEKDGIPKGEYKVRIDFAVGSPPNAAFGSAASVPLIKPIDMTFTVDGKQKVLDIVVERP